MYPAETGRTLHFVSPSAQSRTSPSKMLGSGTARVPSSPCTSMCEAVVATASKLVTIVVIAPDSCTRMPVTWVGVDTGMTSPARSPDWIVRVARVALAAPTTRVTGPSRVTSAVT